MPEYPHRIRLRGPWDYEPLARAAGDRRPLPLPGRVTMPARWRDGGLSDFAGRVRFRRRFGYPGRIDAGEHVWLTGRAVAGGGAVALNDVPLLPAVGPEPWEVEVTAHLCERNELVIDVDGGSDGGLPGEVALEVRALAYLRGVAARVQDGQVVVTGAVVGTCNELLELYLVADRSPAGYQPLQPPALPARFELSTPARHADGSAVGTVVVELVRGAVRWYRVAIDLSVLARSGQGR